MSIIGFAALNIVSISSSQWSPSKKLSSTRCQQQ